MLVVKPNVLFSIFCRNNENIIDDCINSCIEQDAINPYIMTNHLGDDSSFYRAKAFCKDPISYDVNFTFSKKIYVCKSTGQESQDTMRAVHYGLKEKCKYYCFIYSPTVLDKSFIRRSIAEIKEEIVGTYGNLIDSGKKIFTTMVGDINIGPVFVTSEKYARAFNHETIHGYIQFMSNIGCFYRFDEFLMRNQWIKSTLK